MIPNQEENARRLAWVLEDGPMGEINTGDAVQYAPSLEFVKAWNQLAKRTTSYPSDVPAIFAALLYKSAGEILSVAPHHRTQAILRSVDSLPLDILTIDRGSSSADIDAFSPKAHWVPRLPGSTSQVAQLEPAHGMLHMVTKGFLFRQQGPESEPDSTRAVICFSSIPSSGHFVLANQHSEEVFQVRSSGPASVSKGKAKAHEDLERCHLLLLLSKPSLEDPLWNDGILCAVQGHSEGTLRVQIVRDTITWRLQHGQEHDSGQDVVSEWVVVDDSCPILIEMGMFALSTPRMPSKHASQVRIADTIP